MFCFVRIYDNQLYKQTYCSKSPAQQASFCIFLFFCNAIYVPFQKKKNIYIYIYDNQIKSNQNIYYVFFFPDYVQILC